MALKGLSLVERPQWYVARMLNPNLQANYPIVNQEIQLDSDAPFRMTGVAVYVVGASNANQQIQIRFTRSDRSWVQKWLTSAQVLNPFDQGAAAGAGGQTPPFYSYFAPLGSNLMYPPGGSIVIDYTDLVGNALVMVVFIGTKLFERGRIWSPTYPAKYTARPYFGFALQANTALLPVLDLPFPPPRTNGGGTVNADADFVWQAGGQTDQPASALSPVGVQRYLGCRIKDWGGKYYMNDYTPVELIFGFDNQQLPGMLYPEIYIPKNQQIYFDIDAL